MSCSRRRRNSTAKPIGLDIGAESPAEIALSVIGEILQVLRKRKGGHLRGAS